MPIKVWATEWICVICDRVVKPGSGYRKYCSKGCHSMGARFRDQRPKQVSCRRCGVSIDLIERDKNGRLRNVNALLCGKCRKDSRALPIDIYGLAERDGINCLYCGEVVDLSIPSPDNMSPSIDHIKPWSLGGSNEASNLALLHRICNVRKGVAF